MNNRDHVRDKSQQDERQRFPWSSELPGNECVSVAPADPMQSSVHRSRSLAPAHGPRATAIFEHKRAKWNHFVHFPHFFGAVLRGSCSNELRIDAALELCLCALICCRLSDAAWSRRTGQMGTEPNRYISFLIVRADRARRQVRKAIKRK